MPRFYPYKKIFTGSEWLQEHVVVVENDLIIDVVPKGKIPTLSSSFIDATLVPSFIDIQIYGAYGNLLSVYPNIHSLQKLRNYCAAGGALHFIPTVATNTYEVMHTCIDAVKEYWQKGGEGCLGLHLEGPWINKVKRGAHIEALVRKPSLQEVKELLDYGEGVIKIITLAPEVCDSEVIQLIQSRGIIISAGHSNATYTEATTAFNNGIGTATHLFNAMSPFQHRDPGMVCAIFNHPTVMSSIIPDGYHVDFAAIQVAKKIMQQRLFVITDAVTDTTEGPYPHQLAGDKYESSQILSGSALTMVKAVQNLVKHCAIDLEEALRMVSLYPAQAIGLDKELGKIEKGYKASFIVLDDTLECSLPVAGKE
jgi:N-acetylglucosamine-6-phosphate deacetylase